MRRPGSPVGADELLEASRELVLDAVADARADGFDVGEEYSVTDRSKGGSSEIRAARLAQAQAHAAFIRHRVAALVANDQQAGAQIATATEGIDNLTFEEVPGFATPTKDEHNAHNGVQPVDNKTLKDAPAPTPDPRDPSTGEVPDPVGKLSLPDYSPGSLSTQEVRAVYAQGELRMRQLNDQLVSQGVSAEERAKIMSAQRNALRSWTRTLMSDRALAAQVEAENPNLTWDQIIAKYQAKGLTGDDLYNAIIDSSTRSRASVNEALGIDPDNPPPLPQVRPPASFGGAGLPPPAAAPGTAPVINAPPNLPTVLDHPPVAVPPTEFDHPPVAVPPTALDHPPLPPWLQNPSPPGFHVTPGEPPPIFAWDVPDAPQTPVPMPPPSGPPITIPAPPVPPEQAGVGGVIAGVGGIGVWILSQLGKLSHPFSP